MIKKYEGGRKKYRRRRRVRENERERENKRERQREMGIERDPAILATGFLCLLFIIILVICFRKYGNKVKSGLQ